MTLHNDPRRNKLAIAVDEGGVYGEVMIEIDADLAIDSPELMEAAFEALTGAKSSEVADADEIKANIRLLKHGGGW